MGINSSVANWTLLYMAELLSFSLVLLVLIRSELRRPIVYWICSNIFAVFALLAPSTFVETSSDNDVSIMSFAFSAAANIIVYFSANYRQGTSYLRLAVFALIAILWGIGALLPYGWLSSLIVYTGGAILALLCAWAAYRNPLWRGLSGHILLVNGFLICAMLIMWRGLVVFASRSGAGFLVDQADSALGLRMLVFTSFLMQISFVSVIISRDLRQRRIKDREAAREFEINRTIIEEQQEMEALADERLDMISLLTHEVRQPINNAQAALEALDLEMQSAGPDGNETRISIARAQSVLDGITLAISNAILGVSLIDDDHSIHTRPIDAVEIAELACSDCPAEQRHRIRINNGPDAIFADLDPVLVRLALRNLFDNALKYGTPNSLVHLDIAHDEERLGVSFKVTNPVTDTSGLTKDIFRHRVRGNYGSVEGSGHGLFLVKKVADAHHGSISFTIKDDDQVTFDLFIPD